MIGGCILHAICLCVVFLVKKMEKFIVCVWCVHFTLYLGTGQFTSLGFKGHMYIGHAVIFFTIEIFLMTELL